MVPLCLEIPPKTNLQNLRRLVLWTTGAPSTTKHENLLGESAMLSIHDTLTMQTESTWSKWKCLHDRHPILVLTTATTIAISKKKYSIRMASLAQVLTRRPASYTALKTPLIDPCGKPPWIEGLSDSCICPRTVHTTRGLNQNLHCHTIISYTQTAQRWTKKLDVPGSCFRKKINAANHPTFI
jgi:hypothetical protein